MCRSERAPPNGYVPMGGASNYVASAPSPPGRHDDDDDDDDINVSIRDETAHYLKPVSGGKKNSKPTTTTTAANGRGDADVSEPLLSRDVELRDKSSPPAAGGSQAHDKPPTYSVCMADS